MGNILVIVEMCAVCVSEVKHLGMANQAREYIISVRIVRKKYCRCVFRRASYKRLFKDLCQRSYGIYEKGRHSRTLQNIS